MADETPSTTTGFDLKYLKSGWGIALLILYVILLISAVGLKFATGYEDMGTLFLLTLLSTLLIIIVAATSSLFGSDPDKKRAAARPVAYHTIGWIALITLPFDRAPVLSGIAALLLLLIASAGMSWMTAQQAETETTKLMKAVWEKSKPILGIVIAAIILIGFWHAKIGDKRISLGTHIMILWDQKLNFLKKIDTVRRERLEKERAQNLAARSSLHGSITAARPIEGEDLDSDGPIAVVSEDGAAERFRIEKSEIQSQPQPQVEPSLAPTHGDDYLKTEVVGVQEPLSFLGMGEVETHTTGQITSSRILLTVIAPQGAEHVILEGIVRGSSCSGTWRQGNVSGQFLGRTDGQMQIDLYSGNNRIGIVLIAR
jgi:hypothetical protein